MKTPILFLIFNRPSYTKNVFDIIKQIKPEILYVAADGPRKNVKNEDILCNETRKITEDIDWNCKVERIYRDENLGCKKSINNSIDWFFSKEEMGIILEDDCLPTPSFFYFCESMLNKYKDKREIMMICGHNPLSKINELKNDYFFCKYYAIWGWATWKRAWILNDKNMSDWDNQKKYQIIKENFPNKYFLIKNIQFLIELTHKNLINTWDVSWVYTCIKNKSLSIMPKYNTISNIGLEGTHSMNKNILFTKSYNLYENKKNISPEIIMDYALNKKLYRDQKYFKTFLINLIKILLMKTKTFNVTKFLILKLRNLLKLN